MVVDLVLLVALFGWRPWGAIPTLIAGTALFTGAMLGLLMATVPVEASASIAPRAAMPEAPRVPQGEVTRRQWERAVEQHKNVLSAYAAYELDPEMLLRYPAMWDLTAPDVIDFQDTLELTNSVATDDFPGEKIAPEYIDAVAMLRTAWAKADRYARSTGTGNLPDTDAAACDKALKLLRHANGTQGKERAAYLEQVLTTVESLGDRGVIAPPARIHDELSTQVRKAIEQ